MFVIPDNLEAMACTVHRVCQEDPVQLATLAGPGWC